MHGERPCGGRRCCHGGPRRPRAASSIDRGAARNSVPASCDTLSLKPSSKDQCRPAIALERWSLLLRRVPISDVAAVDEDHVVPAAQQVERALQVADTVRNPGNMRMQWDGEDLRI